MDVVPKPDALLALYGTTAEMFETLRAWFDVPPHITLSLETIDSATLEMSDPVLIMGMAMRKLQALHLLSTPGVRTTTDVVIAIVQDLERALVQAPSMRLNVAASSTDWDAALAALDAEPNDVGPARSVDDDDPEATRFRDLHALLHEAVAAVYEASEGEIRYFE